ncbi:MAG: hypothetical protein VKQ33_00845 [Candidatus Sericytochromatia bacterium]|nr:hypothetical protein [Candidatus Sericytochromatia bacterium]
MTTETLPDELVAKLYRDMAFLAAEIAVDRCRTRVLMRLVKERLGIEEADLDAMLREEVGDHLEDFVRRITFPMSAPDVVDEAPASGGCGGACG